MKWTYIIAQKVKAATALGIVFVLLFATSVMDKNNFSELQHSFSSVYKDRLLVESYIYKLSNQLHQKKILMDDLNARNLAPTNEKNQVLNDSIKTLVFSFENTQLTVDEALLLNDLKEHLGQLCLLEGKYSNDGFTCEDQTLKSAIEHQHRKLSLNLEGLSDIQLLESKHIIDNSNQIIASSNITAQLEIGVLIIIGLIVQALIFTSKSMRSTYSQNNTLN
ncbi:MAG: hypothetical protein RIG62_02390 [Cyclobacteriaceae bacterium]